MMDILAAILARTSNPDERMTLAYACGAESNCTPIANAQNGVAQGYYQIIGRGVTSQCANDPVCATNAIYTLWNVPGCTAQQGGLWKTNPLEAAHQAARCVEGGGSTAAANQSPDYGAGSQANAKVWVSKVANPTTTSIPVITGITNLGGAIVQAPASIAADGLKLAIAPIIAVFTNKDFLIRALLVIGGVIVFTSGVSAVTHLPEIAAKAAPLAAAAA